MIQIYQSSKGIGFRIHSDTFQGVIHWVYTIDEKVFKEQLATGHFHGREIDPDILAVMEQVHDEGKILPYYGVGGSSGVSEYHLKLAEAQCDLRVEHDETTQNLVLNTPRNVKRFSLQPPKVRRFRFSPMPYFLKRKLPTEWSGKPPKERILTIVGKEFRKLSKWQNWSYEEALTDRYEYSFGEVSMGRTGYVTKVTDLKTNETIDVTDYADW